MRHIPIKSTHGRIALVLLFVFVGFMFVYNGSGDNLSDEKALYMDSKIVSVNLSNFQSSLKASSGATLIDFRTPEEFDSGRIEGAVNIDFYNPTFSQQLDALDKNEEYFVYCNSGNRSKAALGTMRELGFTNVKELNGGIQAWVGGGNEVCVDC